MARVRDRSADLDEAGLWAARRASRKAAAERSNTLAGGARLKFVQLNPCDQTSPMTVQETSGHGRGMDSGLSCGSGVRDGLGDGDSKEGGAEDDDKECHNVCSRDGGSGSSDVSNECAGSDTGDGSGGDGGDKSKDGLKDGLEDGDIEEDSREDEGEESDDDESRGGGGGGSDGSDVSAGGDTGDGSGDDSGEKSEDGLNGGFGDSDSKEDGGEDEDEESGDDGSGDGRGKKRSKAALSMLRKHRPALAFARGDATLKAGVLHAVSALGLYRIVGLHRKVGQADASPDLSRDADTRADVFVLGRRPRRTVRVLVAMARGCWVVGDMWLLDSLQQRAWKPCAEYVAPLCPAVPSARAAHAAGRTLLGGLLVGFNGALDVDEDVFRLLLEAAGGRFATRGAAVVVEGALQGSQVRLPGGAAVVNQRWLPDSIARWEALPYSDYVAT